MAAATTCQLQDFGQKLASTPRFLWRVTDSNDRPDQTVQMWARVGYAPPTAPAPRRRLNEFIRG